MRAAASTLVTGLYPPAIRDRWGAEISRQVAETGLRSWPDTVAGAVRLWLHPSDWPETFPGQTRRVLSIALAAVAAVTALLLRATPPSAFLTADPHRPVTSLWLVPILLAAAVAVPVPPHLADLRRLLLRLALDAVRTLAAPAAAVTAMVLIARSGAVHDATGRASPVLVAYYWGTLALTARRLCALAARVVHTIPAAPTRRLRASLLLLGTGLALAAAQNLPAAQDPTSVASTLALATLAAATLHTARDLVTTA
ncbi:MAG: hypothetical protein ACJ73S_27255 [Mycobacteriales bacterium]